MYDPADDLLIVPLPDLILGFGAALLVAEPPLTVTYPLPERLTLPDALPALIPIARGLRFATLLTVPRPDLVLGFALLDFAYDPVDDLLTVPRPDLILGFALLDFAYDPADDLLIVPRPDLILGFALLDFDLPDLTFLVLVPLFVDTLTMIMRSCHDF